MGSRCRNVSVGTRALWAAFGGFSVMARPPYYPHMLIIDRSGTIREEHSGRERNYYSYTNLNRFLEKMFPKGGSAAGYLQLAQSFFRAAFFTEAIGCAKVGVATLSRQLQARSGPAQFLRDTISDLDSLIARAGHAQSELTEQDG